MRMLNLGSILLLLTFTNLSCHFHQEKKDSELIRNVNYNKLSEEKTSNIVVDKNDSINFIYIQYYNNLKYTYERCNFLLYDKSDKLYCYEPINHKLLDSLVLGKRYLKIKNEIFNFKNEKNSLKYTEPIYKSNNQVINIFFCNYKGKKIKKINIIGEDISSFSMKIKIDSLLSQGKRKCLVIDSLGSYNPPKPR